MCFFEVNIDAIRMRVRRGESNSLGIILMSMVKNIRDQKRERNYKRGLFKAKMGLVKLLKNK